MFRVLGFGFLGFWVFGFLGFRQILLDVVR